MKKIAISLSIVATLSVANTFMDKDTGLIWQDNSEAKNKYNSSTWEDAITYCENLRLDGYSDWRLPDINELRSIVDYKKYNPAIKNGFRNVGTNRYWSSSTNANGSYGAWFVDFYYGYDRAYRKGSNYLVRCVRDGKETLKFDSFSSLQSALKSKYSGKELTQKAIEIYYGTPIITNAQYNEATSKLTLQISFLNKIKNENVSFSIEKQEAKKLEQNIDSAKYSGIFNEDGEFKALQIDLDNKTYIATPINKQGEPNI